MINEKTLNYIRFTTGYNNLKMEELEMFAESEIEEVNGYHTELNYTLDDLNTNQTLRAFIVEGLLLAKQTRWGNNLDYHVDRKQKYLNKLTNMQV